MIYFILNVLANYIWWLGVTPILHWVNVFGGMLVINSCIANIKRKTTMTLK